VGGWGLFKKLGGDLQKQKRLRKKQKKSLIKSAQRAMILKNERRHKHAER